MTSSGRLIRRQCHPGHAVRLSGQCRDAYITTSGLSCHGKWEECLLRCPKVWVVDFRSLEVRTIPTLHTTEVGGTFQSPGDKPGWKFPALLSLSHTANIQSQWTIAAWVSPQLRDVRQQHPPLRRPIKPRYYDSRICDCSNPKKS